MTLFAVPSFGWAGFGAVGRVWVQEKEKEMLEGVSSFLCTVLTDGDNAQSFLLGVRREQGIPEVPSCSNAQAAARAEGAQSILQIQPGEMQAGPALQQP